MATNRNTGTVRVAGHRTVQDWLQLRARIAQAPDELRLWEEAWEFLSDRLELRYNAPIECILGMHQDSGEGFAATALQCMLIEFLESCYQGLHYRYRQRDDPPLGKHEYSKSAPLFETFLRRDAFAGQFDGVLLRDFYRGVRCKLLHETKTSRDWVIRTRSRSDRARIVECKDGVNILYRSAFQEAIARFLVSYREEICEGGSDERRRFLLRKLDATFDVEPVT
jgi:hypothetical protein